MSAEVNDISKVITMGKFNNEDIKTALGTNEMSDSKTLSRQLFAEFIGTFLYLSIVLFSGTDLGTPTLAVSFANGLLIASIIQIIGPVSGGHINPAVTLGALVCGHIKILKAVSYIISQILGSIMGSFVAYALCDDTSRGPMGATIPFYRLRDHQLFGLEFLMTFLLVIVALSVLDKQRSFEGSGPLAIGLSVTACQASALSYTGSMNPVRSLGPAVVMNIWTSHWVFWVGPLLGGLVAGFFYKVLTLNGRNRLPSE